MKNPLFFLLSSIMLVACSKSSMLCEEVGPNSKQVINSSFVISKEEQNSICDSFAVMLSNQESLAKVIANATTHSNYIDIVFDPYSCDSENQYDDIVDGFSAFDREYQQGFSEMVTKICERSYLRLHAYVPNGAKTICQYNEGDCLFLNLVDSFLISFLRK